MRNRLVENVKEFMSLTLPQLIALRHFYYKQMMAEIKASTPGPKQTHEQASHGWEEFRKGLIK